MPWHRAAVAAALLQMLQTTLLGVLLKVNSVEVWWLE